MQNKKLYVAGGCFWGMEDLFRKVDGVVDTEVGYMGGTEPDPTYENHTGHAEAVEITYDPELITHEKLLDYFFRVHNPTTLNRQGNDVGTSYRSAIFYQNDEEKTAIEKFIDRVNASGRWEDPVTTSLESYEEFYPAEDYHQDYLVKNPGGYTCHMEYYDTYL